MPAEADALRRIRIRSKRRRPPTGRIIYMLIFLLWILCQLAWVVTRAEAGEWWLALFIPVYIWLFVLVRQLTHLWQKLEARGGGKPVSRGEWGMMLALWFAFAFNIVTALR